MSIKKSILLPLLICIVLCLNQGMAQAGNHTKFYGLKEIYKSAYKLERVRSYQDARKGYVDICYRFLEDYESCVDPFLLKEDIAVAISAAFRLAIVTGKDNYTNTYQLVYQINTFKETQKLIERYLSILIDLRTQREDIISKHLYEFLLFARAYNRIGWANKLLISIPWKNYIVFPISDILNMIDLAVLDFEQQLRFANVPYVPISNLYQKTITWRKKDKLFNHFSGVIKNHIQDLPDNALEYQVYKLVHIEDDKKQLSRILSKQYFNQIYEFVDFYHSDFVKKQFARSRKSTSIEEIVSRKNHKLFDVLDRMSRLVGIQ